MASAEVKTVEVERVVKTTEEAIVLTLTKSEAQALMHVVGATSGDCENSSRKYTNLIYRVLEKVGFKARGSVFDYGKNHLHFVDKVD